MKHRHQLGLTIGPVLVAIIMSCLLLIYPYKAGSYSASGLEKASLSQSNNVLKGQAIKTAALKNGYVPFFGSSELSRLDMTHPSVVAKKYHWSKRPFLLGKAGTQSLTHYFAMQDMTSQLKNKKAVVVVSPQWFTKKGQIPAAFSAYYSPLATAQWLLKAKNTQADQYAAKRLLKMNAFHRTSMMGKATLRIANGEQLSANQRRYLQLRLKVLHGEDHFFSAFIVKNKMRRLNNGTKKLPQSYSFTKINRLAGAMGKRNTNSNQLQIENNLYRKKLRGKIKTLKNCQVNLDYRQSPEYSDFELMLNQFKQTNTDVLFIIPPVNAKWAKYTGLSQQMLMSTSHKIKQQLNSQGFNNVLDLTQDGNINYFMQDSIHLGWRGWLAVDQAAQPFIAKRQRTPHYQINRYYFSKNWQEKIVK
ncbi:D-alanyl-lipoteichoic acid biosynthesis protein DltD [Secundilactobacillus hailunensis]|uniref:Protein DltD n=1 Tax=Secundilactobacillus hailunensis TaxID=2559923 RepID=A0ABW1T9H1_9LACO|nr:D-alanyl-lipoteichoic acid biosynthesis protein DltD [Secundilactobacillus hailunensis]